MRTFRKYKVKPVKVDVKLIPSQALRVMATQEDWVSSKILKIATKEANRIIKEKIVCLRCDGEFSPLNITLDGNQRYVHLNDCG